MGWGVCLNAIHGGHSATNADTTREVPGYLARPAWRHRLRRVAAIPRQATLSQHTTRTHCWAGAKIFGLQGDATGKEVSVTDAARAKPLFGAQWPRAFRSNSSNAPACLHEKAKKVKTPWRLHLRPRRTVHRSTLPAFALDVSHCGARCHMGFGRRALLSRHRSHRGAFWQASQSPEIGIR
jgi:hypothetical protein